jgi:hypothetical protein
LNKIFEARISKSRDKLEKNLAIVHDGLYGIHHGFPRDDPGFDPDAHDSDYPARLMHALEAARIDDETGTCIQQTNDPPKTPEENELDHHVNTLCILKFLFIDDEKTSHRNVEIATETAKELMSRIKELEAIISEKNVDTTSQTVSSHPDAIITPTPTPQTN